MTTPKTPSGTLLWILNQFECWGEHPRYPLRDWQYAVANGDTRCGYSEWVAGQLQDVACEALPADDGHAVRMRAALNAALESFWSKIAQAYPEITTGDCPPDVVVRLERAARVAVQVWIEANRN